MNENLKMYMTPYVYLQYQRFVAQVDYDRTHGNPPDRATEEMAQDLRNDLDKAVMVVTDTTTAAHHFPMSEETSTQWLDADSRYRFLLTDRTAVPTPSLEAMLRFADYLDGEVAFAMICDNVLVMLELDELGDCRESFEAAVYRAMAAALSEMPDFSTRTQQDGWGLVFRGPAVIAMVPPEQVDAERDEVPLHAALYWRTEALQACEEEVIHLLAVPAGWEHLLAYADAPAADALDSEETEENPD